MAARQPLRQYDPWRVRGGSIVYRVKAHRSRGRRLLRPWVGWVPVESPSRCLEPLLRRGSSAPSRFRRASGLFGVRRTASPAGGHAQCLAPLELGAETLVELRARCSQTCRALVRSAATTSEGKKGGEPLGLETSRPLFMRNAPQHEIFGSTHPQLDAARPGRPPMEKNIARRRKNEHAGNLQRFGVGVRELVAWRRVEGRRKLTYLACPPAMPGSLGHPCPVPLRLVGVPPLLTSRAAQKRIRLHRSIHRFVYRLWLYLSGSCRP